jgi:sugar lactone lactonase YvrE
MTARERTPRVLASGLAFGEGPRWRAGRLWLSDMHDFQVVTVDLAGRLERVLRVAGRPSGLGWLPDGRMLVVSMEDRKLYRTSGGPGGSSLELHADLSGFAAHEINDLVVDADGLAYVSQFGYAFATGGEFRKTEILLVMPDGRVRVAARELAFPNGMVITPDGRHLIVGESFAARLTCFEREKDGALTGRRVFAKLSGAVPDGICLDAEGCVWVASPISRECLRVREGGEVVERVRTESQSIACMLGGEDRRTLFVLTSEVIDAAECARRKTARVEIAQVDVPGAGWP